MKHNLEKLGAATALTSVLLGGVACNSERTQTVEVPTVSTSTASPDFKNSIDESRDRVGRCVLDVSRTAILDVMNSHLTKHEPAKVGFFEGYVYSPETSSVAIDTSVSGQTTFVYSVKAREDEPVSYAAKGRITLPVESSRAKEALENLNPATLSADVLEQTIDFSVSGVTKRQTSNGKTSITAGSVIQKADSPDLVATNCAIAEDFAEIIEQEFKS